MRVKATTRNVPSSLAGILEALELRQPAVVTAELLSEVIGKANSPLSLEVVAERLVRIGWLLPLRSRRAWEFAPASRAGRYRSGDPYIELRALRAHKPDAPIAVAFESAVWELGFSRHQSTTAVVAHQPGWRPPRSLGDLKSVTYDWRLPTWDKQGLPVWQAATAVVAAAHRPDVQGDWSNADDWLPETMRATTPDEVLTEAVERGVATLARLAYFAEWSGRHDIAEQIEQRLSRPLAVSFLGPRKPRGRWVNRWRLYDALLPER